MALIISIKGERLAAGLSKVLKVRSTNAVLPIVENVLVQTVPKGAVLTCTNLDSTIITGISATTAEPKKSFLITPSVFNVLTQLPAFGYGEDIIEIYEVAEGLEFKYGDNYIRCANENAAAYPPVPTFEALNDFVMPDSAETIARVFSIAARFAGSDELKQNLTGVCFTQDSLYGTDAFRLIKCRIEAGKNEFSSLVSKACVIGLTALDPAATNIRVQMNESFISFNDKATKVISRLINAAPPKYSAVFPKTTELEIETSRLDLLKNIKLARSVATTSDSRIALIFGAENKYTLTGGDSELTQEIKLTGAYAWVKNDKLTPSFEVHLNGKFFQQALELNDQENIKLEISEPEKPIVIKDEGYTFLVIPLRMPKK